MRITILTVPHHSQAYPTIGDYSEHPNGDISIRISDMGDDRYHSLVAIHEFIELMLCKQRGIKFSDIDAYDIEYEKNRKEDDQESEPGAQSNAPYHKEHMFAENIERQCAKEMGVDWEIYNNTVNSL